MLAIFDRPLPPSPSAVLAVLQGIVNRESDYAEQIRVAKAQWAQKNSTSAKSNAFRDIRKTLAEMCIGPIRCAYCEDSLADEVEHILPKSLFPDAAFQWRNYLFACGPCNAPKSSRYGVVSGETVEEFIRNPRLPVVRPPSGVAGLINPRAEDPFVFLELDMGGTTPEGREIDGTFDFVPTEGLTAANTARARFTIDVLGLNREVIRVARANAFGGFRARLSEYADRKEAGAGRPDLDRLKNDLLGTPHLTVFAEMRRQRAFIPEIDHLFDRVPEALTWPVVKSAE